MLVLSEQPSMGFMGVSASVLYLSAQGYYVVPHIHGLRPRLFVCSLFEASCNLSVPIVGDVTGFLF